MTRKLSIVRFKPKPECFDEFLQNIQAWQSQIHSDNGHLLMRTNEEVVAVVGSRPINPLEAVRLA